MTTTTETTKMTAEQKVEALKWAASQAFAAMPAPPPPAAYREDRRGAHERVREALYALASGSGDRRHVGTIKADSWDMLNAPYAALERVLEAFYAAHGVR